jgi:hypothetical protein
MKPPLPADAVPLLAAGLGGCAAGAVGATGYIIQGGAAAGALGTSYAVTHGSLTIDGANKDWKEDAEKESKPALLVGWSSMPKDPGSHHGF